MTELSGIEVDGRGFILRKGGGWLRGFDVSHHQSPGKVALEGQDFLVARAAYGKKPDDTFALHVKHARAAGLLTGAYLFYRQTQSKEDQLAAFLRATGGVEMDIVPALDLEWNTDYDGEVDRDRHNTDGRWLAEQIADRFGGCLIYTAPFFWADKLGRPEWCAQSVFHFWLAHYGVPEGQPRLPTDCPVSMTSWAIHQYQGKPLDSNVANYLPAIRIADTDRPPAPES